MLCLGSGADASLPRGADDSLPAAVICLDEPMLRTLSRNAFSRQGSRCLPSSRSALSGGADAPLPAGSALFREADANVLPAGVLRPYKELMRSIKACFRSERGVPPQAGTCSAI